ncbi:MAG: V-type ATP synthase subunit B, partial [Clostridiales bacterium]|nr:V-type ATP synthase subunit B [Clostridiales bacterium]
MIFEYVGLSRIIGSLVVLDGVEGASFEEMAELKLADGSVRHGRIIRIDGKQVTIQVFEGTRGISMEN